MKIARPERGDDWRRRRVREEVRAFRAWPGVGEDQRDARKSEAKRLYFPAGQLEAVRSSSRVDRAESVHLACRKRLNAASK